MVLAPGTPVLEKDLTQRFGISRTPVREAVLRLSDERLLEVVPKSGTFVARISISVLREALVARRALEAVTVRAAARNATQDQIIELKAIIQSQRKHAEAGDEEAFHRADEAFHAGLAETGNYRGIWVIIQQVKMHIDRYRLLTLPQPGRMMLVLDEHSSVLDAVQDGDADRAVAQMEAHLNKLRLDIAVFRDIWPDYFIHDLPMGDDTAN
jgi:DNA-binding GntR family transcriptional regulator